MRERHAYEVTEHNDESGILLPDHPPEIGRRIFSGSLSANRFLVVEQSHVGGVAETKKPRSRRKLNNLHVIPIRSILKLHSFRVAAKDV